MHKAFFRAGNFCALEAEYSHGSESRFAVIPVPYEGTVTFGTGSRRGPSAILRASQEIELHDFEIGSDTYLAGIHTLPELEPVVDPSEMVNRVQAVTAKRFLMKQIPVLLGGEHTISIGAVRAAADHYPNLTALHFDAHADLRDRYQDSPYSHACTARRISESCPVVVVGVRACSSEEKDFLKAGKANMYPAMEVKSDAFSFHSVLNGLTQNVYISIDMDVFDPSLIPATGTPEPGGLSWEQVTGFVEKVCQEKNVIGIDCVEVAPVSGSVSSEYIAAKLVYRIMGFICKKNKWL